MVANMRRKVGIGKRSCSALRTASMRSVLGATASSGRGGLRLLCRKATRRAGSLQLSDTACRSRNRRYTTWFCRSSTVLGIQKCQPLITRLLLLRTIRRAAGPSSSSSGMPLMLPLLLGPAWCLVPGRWCRVLPCSCCPCCCRCGGSSSPRGRGLTMREVLSSATSSRSSMALSRWCTTSTLSTTLRSMAGDSISYVCCSTTVSV
mmetsp:Transcript_36491/g.81226  ORF Transcript_36491/g.81226 Transcript_36491/m.81226 type:complete len:205 (+) Transcript_36491:1966-2580(+)